MSLPVPKKDCDECREPMKYCGAHGKSDPERWIQIGECKNRLCRWYLKQIAMHILPKEAHLINLALEKIVEEL